ncbi:hypothetical protein FB009_12033 [Sinorhizobium medicae]|uniref:hypothetical protein n=1 Tax=Sinorhizobium medicae TaxID=110321 RepID=UPI0011990253|nr:hypothetical protein [Sinorhizobium medicae]MQU73584.1 hypothetical protein [Sinorhizobium medicae]TWA33332.1 hypothetical protein FB009_12033 [Sinorhizobium medicae]
MIFKIGPRSVFCAFAVAVVVLNLFAISPARASSETCHVTHAANAVGQHRGAEVPQGCCDATHCCPMLPCLPAPDVPVAIRHQHHPVLKVEQPLLLVTSIDPPPRSAVS